MELEILREKVKKVKQEKNINYSYFAKEIGINKQSFYNFMSATRGLSEERKGILEDLVEKFK